MKLHRRWFAREACFVCTDCEETVEHDPYNPNYLKCGCTRTPEGELLPKCWASAEKEIRVRLLLEE